jgi:hypothetical protein
MRTVFEVVLVIATIVVMLFVTDINVFNEPRPVEVCDNYVVSRVELVSADSTGMTYLIEYSPVGGNYIQLYILSNVPFMTGDTVVSMAPMYW